MWYNVTMGKERKPSKTPVPDTRLPWVGWLIDVITWAVDKLLTWLRTKDEGGNGNGGKPLQ